MPPVEVGGGERREGASPGEGAEGKAERSLLKVVWVDTHTEDAREQMFPRRLGEEENFFVRIGNVGAG